MFVLLQLLVIQFTSHGSYTVPCAPPTSGLFNSNFKFMMETNLVSRDAAPLSPGVDAILTHTHYAASPTLTSIVTIIIGLGTHLRYHPSSYVWTSGSQTCALSVRNVLGSMALSLSPKIAPSFRVVVGILQFPHELN